MITNNKILTVSYGTFSCTLEGFDDSFGTMKAIAEYFRDLASDDRYFGAEPPQPDVEMLARIAQKEISRRVEAREHEGNYVLSAVDDTHVATPDAAALAGAAAAGVAATALMQDSADSEEMPEEAPATDLSAGTTDAIADTPAEEPAAQVDEAAQALEAEHSDEDLHEDLAEVETDTFVEDEQDIVPGQPDAEVKAFFANNPTGTNQSDFEEIAELPVETDTPVETSADAGVDTIAAKLQRIRAVVAQQDDTVDETAYAEDEHAEDDTIDVSEAEHDAEVAADEITEAFEDAAEDSAEKEDLQFEDLQTEKAETPVEDAAQDALEDVDTPSFEAPKDSDLSATSEQDAEDDIADILSRLDAAEAAEAQVLAEDLDGDANTLISEDLSGSDADDDGLENLFEAEEASADATADTPALDAGTDDNVAAYAASAEQRIDVKPMKTPAEEALADAADAMAARSTRARVIKVKRADLNAAIKRGDLEEYTDEAPKRSDLDKHHLAPGKFGTSTLSPEDEAELARELAALEADIEMDQVDAQDETPVDDLSEAMTLSEDMRTDIDTGAAQDGDDWTSEADEAAADVPEQDQTTLDQTALDEAINAAHDMPEPQETAAEKAIVDEVEEEPVDERATAAAARRDAMPSPDVRRRGYMSRLLAETDQHMDEPEGATRRDAFAHLRAAVAAKKADDALGAGSDTIEGDDAYRNDLADVVRPRRPDRSGARTPRPGEGGPAPLKLVAEQRIDTEDSTAADPVRPRRVEAVDDAAHSEGESFADFATEMGATTLPQQLEAAAAYMSFVEGRDQFSRPQLMAKVRQVNAQDGFSREDGLRHFGQLLRSGKIEKVKGGRFTVSEDIGFRPDHRAAS